MDSSPASPSLVQPPSQYADPTAKGQDILDFADFSIADGDHRKRRRNRTTQSCLNCHTSKRKCDRKRPCSRCIQLGLTGLCVYEVDDPSLRDDPNVDETTHLRNRIAELESLVRELRGKPHPRWADSSYAEGDPQDKWHSRASKRPHISLSVRRHRDHLALGSVPDFSAPHLLGQNSPSIKSEPGHEFGNAFPYRFSPSPESHASSPYTPYTTGQPNVHGYPDPNTHSRAQQQQQQGGYRDAPSETFYSPYSPTPPQFPTHQQHHHRASDPGHSSPSSFCSCLSNPGGAHHMIMLSQQLRSTLQALMALPEHAMAHQAQACILTRRVRELNDLLHSLASSHSGNTDASPYGAPQRQPQRHQHQQQQQQPHSSHGYPPQVHHAQAMHYTDTLSTPPDSEVMTPLSSAEAAPVPAAQMHEWAAMGSSFNPYFPPLPPTEKGHIPDDYSRQGAMVV